ncbi:hypothetical protein FIBSPDRAFT_884490 [Athelia psychrophila]|uniref:Uncharacterized protein n=1 Tax=Athelia psychrophila TaxID=1759441 RepID=A0A166T6H6_9AGAM|nr:hypothetical protein FIBSPDRAFT_884490 [Fibularhizoctonia sp. CBS 109695]
MIEGNTKSAVVYKFKMASQSDGELVIGRVKKVFVVPMACKIVLRVTVWDVYWSPSLVPPQSAGRVTLGGAFRVNPGWPRWVDTLLFVDIESGAQPLCLAVPHSLNLPITRLSWTHPMRHWCRSLLKDISCFPIQVVVFEEVEDVSVYNITVQGLPGDDDFLNSAAGRCIDSDSEDDDSVGYRSEMGWSESSESVHQCTIQIVLRTWWDGTGLFTKAELYR